MPPLGLPEPDDITGLSSRVLRLRDVASWQLPQILVQHEREMGLSKFRPGIPSLQRGAVWKPKQIEMLWDSLMRGFPVGSFIVCPHSPQEKQILRQGIHACASELTAPPFTHQLLDGQQRANAIALGYLDPKSHGAASLWLDLLGDCREDRRYLFRVTTQAHPWGYSKDFSKLSAGAIRDALGDCGSDAIQAVSGRKQTYGFWPADAVLPVPVVWLLDPALGFAAMLSGVEVLAKLRAHASSISPSFYARLLQALEQATLSNAQWKRMSLGLSRLSSARLIALEVAEEVLKDAEGETQEEQGSNVEHLFTRLNSGGTVLDGSELSYSLIKAYWPEIESKIAALPRVDTEARLASLAFRDALSLDPIQDGFARNLKIAEMRRIALADAADQLESAFENRQKIRFHLDLDPSEPSPTVFPFLKDLLALKGMLEECPQHPFGLHPFLRNDLLGGNPELVLLLLHIVRRLNPSPDNPLHRKRVIGFATALHWFAGGTESERRFAASQAARHFGKDADWSQFHGILGACHLEGKGMIRLVSPGVLEGLIPPFNASLVEFLRARSDHLWTFWRELSITQGQGDTPKDWPFVERLKSLRRLLVYSQRAFMSVQFANYDTVEVGAWDDHNRPWDYDHVLPQSVLYNMKREGLVFKKTADEWLNTIGNMRVWPLSGNRSRQNETASDAIQESDLALSNVTEAEVKGFSRKTNDFAHLEPTLEFLNAARSRMMRMYRDWYETLEIGVLMGESWER